MAALSWLEEEEEEEFFNHYKNDLNRHAHTPSGVAHGFICTQDCYISVKGRFYKPADKRGVEELKAASSFRAFQVHRSMFMLPAAKTGI